MMIYDDLKTSIDIYIHEFFFETRKGIRRNMPSKQFLWSKLKLGSSDFR